MSFQLRLSSEHRFKFLFVLKCHVLENRFQLSLPSGHSNSFTNSFIQVDRTKLNFDITIRKWRRMNFSYVLYIHSVSVTIKSNWERPW